MINDAEVPNQPGSEQTTAARDGNAGKRRPNQPRKTNTMRIKIPHKRGRPFQPGNRFGHGRPAGSRNKASLLLDQLLEGEGPAILQKVIQHAKKGDRTAMRLCLERLCPPRRERLLKLALPEIHTASDVNAAFRTVVQALGQGEITTDQAEHFINVLEFGRKAIDTEQVANRLAKLEEQLEIARRWSKLEDRQQDERAA